ncbi:glycosyltransferase [Sediminicola sp. YIK13]|uniref:TIGR04282 family arsenosugar biosynthesis glycosyltransferase n=1 Tax=Sediminicola sp. YIK13 TaxID=1453352 RepID=UPI000722E3DE|nr:TIGR04282 family arsenosugar biosynthesis glycosyltransferase [Sediminicola sp. YIK13]ALM08059.1 glycosyltransferase [Sediminicola sp. YIK13]
MTSSSNSLNQKNLLLIFTRNPELGKCKTRLAAKVGDHTALKIYTFLLEHTHNVTKEVKATREVHYSEEIWENDIWENTLYHKKIQQGKDLGERMLNAFNDGFEAGYENIIVIGSDMYDLSSDDLNTAFEELHKTDFVIGPAEDGGYYLLGMSKIKASLFKNKAWGTNTVLNETLNDLKNESVKLLKIKNDVDLYEDIQNIDAFQPFLKNI